MEANETDIAARRFLRTGSTGVHGESAVAAACEKLIQKAFRTSIRRALGLAERFHARAQAHGGRVLGQTAWRSLGRMHHFSGRHAEARHCYRAARTLCGDDLLIRGRIDRTLIDINMYLGNDRAAAAAGRAALRAFSALEAESDLAQTRVNLGNLYHRRDKPVEADRLYRQAALFFARSGNKLALARTNYNRANVLVQLFQMDEAEKLYRDALAAYTESGYELDACDTRYALAWLNLLTGRFHQALSDLAACEATYRTAGDPRGVALCLLDRAEVFLQLGLYRDALDLAGRAGKRFRTLKLEYESGKAHLFAAYALTGLGRKDRARAAWARAEQGFAALRHAGYLGTLHLLRTDLDQGSPGTRQTALRAARRCFDRAALFFWQAVCDLKAIELSGRTPVYLARLRRNPAAWCVPHLYAAWQVAEGDLHLVSGRRAAALTAWRKAADRLDLVRSALPPMELRNQYARAAKSPHERLVESYFSDTPREAAAWSERARTAGIWNAGARHPALAAARRRVQQSLGALSARVQTLAQELMIPAHRSIGAGAALPSAARLNFLRREIRECLLTIDQAPTAEALDTARLGARIAAASRQAPIVQFQVAGGDILAFVHVGGEVATRRFVGGRERLERLAERWRFCIERNVVRHAPAQESRTPLEQALWREFGAWLWAALEIPDEAAQVIIVPDGPLANLPWQAIECDGGLLGERHALVLAPSLRHHWFARTRPGAGLPIHLFRGAGSDLASAQGELARLAALAPGRTIMHAPATRASWPQEGEFFIWHYAGHAQLVVENPFYSYLRLEDGPLFAADFQIRSCRVELATLAACRSGEEVTLPGEESTGFVRALLEMGARNVLAGRWPVLDQSTALYMEHFYAELLSSKSLVQAMHNAERRTRLKYPSAYHWAAFGLHGAGFLGEDHAKTP